MFVLWRPDRVYGRITAVSPPLLPKPQNHTLLITHAQVLYPVGRAGRGGVAHRGRLLKLDLDATAGGVFDGLLGGPSPYFPKEPSLLGLVVELVELQAATGRPQVSDVGAGARATRPPKGRRGLGAHAAHEEGSIA